MAQGTFNVAANADDGKWVQFDGSFANDGNSEIIGKSTSEGNLFLLFSSVTIPQGATISSASITLKSDGSGDLPVPVDIYASDADNPLAPASNAECTGATPTTASTYWNIESWSTSNQSPDIKSVIQEIVNREGWQSGNSILLFVKYRNGEIAYGKTVSVYMREIASGIYKATLDVEWSESSGTIKAGSSSISKIYVGSSEVLKVYIGPTQVWP